MTDRSSPDIAQLLARAETYININAPDGRGSALLVMELADALRASQPTTPSFFVLPPRYLNGTRLRDDSEEVMMECCPAGIEDPDFVESVEVQTDFERGVVEGIRRREALANEVLQRTMETEIENDKLREQLATPSDFEQVFRDACDEAGCEYDNEALLQAIADLTSYPDMLWAWFTERRGNEDMRANAAQGGLSADDFKQMLDEHESNLLVAQPSAGSAELLALADELKRPGGTHPYLGAKKRDMIVSALRGAAQPPAKPVAWRYRFVTSVDGKEWSDWFVVDDPKSIPSREGQTVQPLYADVAQPSGMREALIRVTASLAAAISILERTPSAKKAAPSNKMFDMMLSDYRKSLEVGRDALALTSTEGNSRG